MTDQVQEGKPVEGKHYMCFTLATPADSAAVLFERRYGYPPQENFIYKGNRWCGPLQQRLRP
jgi:hypothetical protein